MESVKEVLLALVLFKVEVGLTQGRVDWTSKQAMRTSIKV